MTKLRYDFLCGCLTLAVAVLKAVVKTSTGRDSGYGLIFEPGPILGYIRYVHFIPKTNLGCLVQKLGKFLKIDTIGRFL